MALLLPVCVCEYVYVWLFSVVERNVGQNLLHVHIATVRYSRSDRCAARECATEMRVVDLYTYFTRIYI